MVILWVSAVASSHGCDDDSVLIRLLPRLLPPPRNLPPPPAAPALMETHTAERLVNAAQAVLSGYDTVASKQWREEDRSWRKQDLAWRSREEAFMLFEQTIMCAPRPALPACLGTAPGTAPAQAHELTALPAVAVQLV